MTRPSPATCPGGRRVAEAPAGRSRCVGPASTPRPEPARRRGPTRWRWSGPGASKSTDTAVLGLRRERLVPPELVERERRGPHRLCLAGVAQAPLEELPVVVVHHRSDAEVEQPAGDDVPLDLRRAAVDGGRPRVQELAAPPLAGRRRRPRPARGPGRRPPGRRAPVRPWPPGPCRSRSRGRGARRRPVGTGWPGTGPAGRRGAGSTSPTSAGSRVSDGTVSQEVLQPPVQVGGAMPQGRAPLEGEQVHGHRPPLAFLAEGAVDGHGHVVEEDLGELGQAVHRLDRPHDDAGAVHVDEQGGDAPVGRVGRPGAGQEHATVGVLGQAGPDLLAGDPPDVAGARGPAGQGGQVAAGARLRKALAPGLLAAQQPRHHVGGQLRSRHSRSWSGPAPRSSSRCPARPGPGRSAPRPGRPAAASIPPGPRPVAASPSASSRPRR